MKPTGRPRNKCSYKLDPDGNEARGQNGELSGCIGRCSAYLIPAGKPGVIPTGIPKTSKLLRSMVDVSDLPVALTSDNVLKAYRFDADPNTFTFFEVAPDAEAILNLLKTTIEPLTRLALISYLPPGSFQADSTLGSPGSVDVAELEQSQPQLAQLPGTQHQPSSPAQYQLVHQHGSHWGNMAPQMYYHYAMQLENMCPQWVNQHAMY